MSKQVAGKPEGATLLDAINDGDVEFPGRMTFMDWLKWPVVTPVISTAPSARKPAVPPVRVSSESPILARTAAVYRPSSDPLGVSMVKRQSTRDLTPKKASAVVMLNSVLLASS